MINAANYEKLAARINPIVFKRYLLRTGWVPFETKRDDIAVLQHFHDDTFEQVVIPYDRVSCDYSKVLAMSVCDVAKCENKTVAQMLLTLLNAYSDVLTIQVHDPSIGLGSLSLDAAIALFENTQKLLAGGARDVLYPRQYHPTQPDESVQEFVRLCRFGQTETGSYAASVVCPFVEAGASSYRQLSALNSEAECAQSLTRKVTRHIVEAIHSMKSAVDAGSCLDIPVSANFCDAVANICDQHPKAEVVFQVQWSPLVRENIPPFSSVNLTSDYVAPLKAISRSLKPKTEQMKKIVGYVQLLKAEPSLENRQSGEIEVVYLDEQGKTGILTASLDLESYQQAIEAHQKGLYVSMKGTIPGGSKKMDCISFRLIADE